ncbi:MAG: vWA domain-containing protein [Anaerotignaceae bacterium]
MEKTAEIKAKLDEIAKEIIMLTKGKLFINFRFLDKAISRLQVINNDLIFQLATNGNRLYFCSQCVVETYKKDVEKLNRSYLHSVLHCIFKHTFVSQNLNKDYWNLATDIAVENILTELKDPQINCDGVHYQYQMLAILKNEIKPLTAEKIYKFLLDKKYSEEEIKRLQEYFYRDNHGLWWEEETPPTGEDESPINMESLMKEWEEISKMLDVDLETVSKDDKNTDTIIQNLKELNREKYDYTDFLKKFAVKGEDLAINHEEFDYIYYTYGLQQYGNMPLIEPLEYRDIEKINDFVIAIDTSGSVKGDMVQRFLNKTYSIFMSEESFFKKINVHIIQCDMEIQEEVKITCKEDFDQYIKSMKIKGFGGTDFKPVFNRINTLVKEKEFHKLKGLIYFTDGYGTYPEKSPEFQSAFIYLGYDPQRPPTPPWAIKLILEENQLAEDLK